MRFAATHHPNSHSGPNVDMKIFDETRKVFSYNLERITTKKEYGSLEVFDQNLDTWPIVQAHHW